MDRQEFEVLVSRWVAGDRLAAAEEDRLLHWLHSDPAARDALLKDETLDSLLQSWPWSEATADDFVQNCLRRVATAWSSERDPVPAVEAPPVVAPPIVIPRASVATVPPRREPFGRHAHQWLAAAAACCAALVLAAIGWRWLAQGPQPLNQNQLAKSTNESPSPPPEGPAPRPESIVPRPAVEGAFATLAKCVDAAWGTPRSEGDRLAAGVLKLTSGTAELRFDKGTIARMIGPAVLELRSEDEVLLKSGSISARVPPPAVGFCVTTPLARVVDLGTEFDVFVAGSGTTQTFVRRGRVSFRPQRGQDELGSPIELAAGALDRATVSAPRIAAPVVPVTIIAEGSQGRFLGRVSARGKTAEFHSAKALEAFRVAALRQLGESPAEFGKKWPALVDGVAATAAKNPPERRPAAVKDGGAKPQLGVAAKDPRNVVPQVLGEDQVVEVQEDGRKVSIIDSKDSGITVTVTESVGGTKKTTRVYAADPAELAKKSPEAHQLYRKYVRPRPKGGKAK